MSVLQPVSLNLNVRGMGQSATLAIKQKCRELKRQGKQVYDFGLGQSPFPVPDPVVDALRLAAPEKDYLPVSGLPALCEAVAEFHRKKDMFDVCPECVLVGPGSKELMFILQIVYYGEILLRTPCWVSYMPQARIIGRRISLIPTSFDAGWKITPDWLLQSLKQQGDDARPRLLIMNYPSNPTGHTYTADELKELVEVIRQFEIIVLSDEIYGQTHFKGEHVSVARFYPERTIVSSGLSKWCGAGGWRLGTFYIPPELDWLRKAMAAVASETYTSVSAPIQYAAVQAFHGGAFMERYLWHCRRILGALAERCVDILRDGGIRVQRPHGGFYLFLDFGPMSDRLRARGIEGGGSLCDRLVEETGVAILPGAAFGRSRDELTARLSYVDFDGAAVLAASEAMAQEEDGAERIVEQYCGRVIEGIERIVEWAHREA